MFETKVSRRAFGLGAITGLMFCDNAVQADVAETSGVFSLRGVGASVPHPVYMAWVDRFGAELGVSLRYLPLGSGAGLRAARNWEADFGGSDVEVSRPVLESAGLVQVPTVAAALGFAVNLPDTETDLLRLRRSDLRGIFDGEIRVWSDARLRASNPGLFLPDLAITPVVRREVSGTSRLTEAWLAGRNTAPQVAEQYSDVPFEATPGLAVFGSHGVAQTVHRLRGSIGYLELSIAQLFGLGVLALERSDGRFADWRQARAMEQNDWPFLARTGILIPRADALAERSAAVARFFGHCLLHGGDLASSVGFVPLQPAVRDASLAQLQRLVSRG